MRDSSFCYVLRNACYELLIVFTLSGGCLLNSVVTRNDYEVQSMGL